MVAVGPVYFGPALVVSVNQLVCDSLIDSLLIRQMVLAEDYLRSICSVIETAINLSLAEINFEEISLWLTT
jgi:hypothetical protein